MLLLLCCGEGEHSLHDRSFSSPFCIQISLRSTAKRKIASSNSVFGSLSSSAAVRELIYFDHLCLRFGSSFLKAGMEQYGNKATFNLESVLVKNIKDSLYYVKQALDLDHVHEVIDEIYEKCVTSTTSASNSQNDFLRRSYMRAFRVVQS